MEIRHIASDEASVRGGLRPASRWIDPTISIALVVSTFATYHAVLDHAFVDFDDYIYIRDHPWLRDPLDIAWLRRALLEPHAAYWIPLTWLSLRIDFALYGTDPTGYLVTNVILHAMNGVLLYATLARATSARRASAFVAFCFALHPLHVESVAWASERKDVLATFFWMLATWLYVRAQSVPRASPPGIRRVGWNRLALTLCMVLGLLSKPSIVTLPFSLLLLDFWPLDRLRQPDHEGGSLDPHRVWSAMIEKAPLFVVALGGAIVVFGTQQDMGGRSFAAHVPLGLSLANAVESYGFYIEKFLWPSQLAAFYPLDPYGRAGLDWLPWSSALVAITVACAYHRRRAPWAITGWLWFLGNLVPVIGLVGVGMQARADRWAHVPSIGLSWILAWGAGSVVRSLAETSFWRRGALARRGPFVLGLVTIAGLAVCATRQVSTWRDTVTLFEHADTVTRDNWYARHRLAVVYRQDGDLDRAFELYVSSLVALPEQARTQGELGDVALALGRIRLARRLHENARVTGWHDPHAPERLARILIEAGLVTEARRLLEGVQTRRPPSERRRQLLREAPTLRD